MVAVLVEGRHGGRLRAGDRDEDLELERLLALTGGQQAAAAAEERVRGIVELGVESHRLQQRQAVLGPVIAPLRHRLGRSEAHELVLAEHLAPRRVV